MSKFIHRDQNFVTKFIILMRGSIQRERDLLRMPHVSDIVSKGKYFSKGIMKIELCSVICGRCLNFN